MDSESNQKIQEIQFLEQNLQSILIQKQNFQIELAEVESALHELEKSGEDTYKIIGQFMIRTEKSKIKKELEDRKTTLNLRMKTLETQEKNLSKNIDTIREGIIKTKE